jgi:diguanylate cyclase (GGDEF)-like protein
MNTKPPETPSEQALPPADTFGGAGSPLPGMGLRALLVAANLLLVALTAVLDYQTGPHLSFGIFYLIPVAACAWWGGFPHGILAALAGSVAWHLVDRLENPLIPVAAGAWNGVVRFGTLALTSSLLSRVRLGVQRERRLARTDALTGAANSRTFYEAAAAEAERARRSARPLTLAYLDLDDFKQLNDRLGHAAGDAALRHVVRTAHLHLRASDLLARLGGDEFALLLPGAGPEGAASLLARLQERLARDLASHGWPVTLSVGAITFLRPPGDVDWMVQRVDALMYGAKRKGKGRVEHEVVKEEASAPSGPWPGAERRATARVLCGRAAVVRREGAGDARLQFATLRDISAGGVGLRLGEPLPPDTVVVVEALRPGTRALLARVVRVTEEEGGWLHGCVLSTRLGTEEVRGWLAAETQ